MNWMRRVSVEQACPLWCRLVVDSLFALPEEESLYTQGYPDGLVLLITGKFPFTVSELIERALNREESWYRAKKPSVSPNKTEIVLLSKRKTIDRFIEPDLLNGENPTTSVMYLRLS
jgi:hypothetical protein